MNDEQMYPDYKKAPKPKKAKPVAKPVVEEKKVVVKPIGKNRFETVYEAEGVKQQVLPLPGIGCVLDVNGALTFIPGVRLVDGAIIK